MNCLHCLHIQNLRVFHKQGNGQEVQLINVPDLAFNANEITALVGASGSGKSTLLRAINRLNECWSDLRTEGQVSLFLEGQQWHAYPAAKKNASLQIYPLDKLRRKVGMVFQHPHLLPLSIARNITLPLIEACGVTKKTAEEYMEKSLKQVGLWHEVKDRLTSGAERLSGGQMQRLCLARALALNPEILLLDEPTAFLDAKATLQVEEAIKALAGQLSIVLVTHSQEQANNLASTQIRMHGDAVEKNSQK